MTDPTHRADAVSTLALVVVAAIALSLFFKLGSAALFDVRDGTDR